MIKSSQEQNRLYPFCAIPWDTLNPISSASGYDWIYNPPVRVVTFSTKCAHYMVVFVITQVRIQDFTRGDGGGSSKGETMPAPALELLSLPLTEGEDEDGNRGHLLLEGFLVFK